MTQGQFLSRAYMVLILSFPSSRLVASPRLKNPVCPKCFSINLFVFPVSFFCQHHNRYELNNININIYQ